MLRFYYVIARNIFRIPVLIHNMRKMASEEIYPEKECYEYAGYIAGLIQKAGCIRTEGYGTENLPAEGGYILYPNHQGKYDAYGIAVTHKKTCSVVMDIKKSNGIFIREVIDMLKGKRLDTQDVKQALTVINAVAGEVKEGRRYVIFPEGGYDKVKKNTLTEFRAGCFKASIKSKTPIVPVALIDSYKALDGPFFGKVTTQVHYLKPVPYEEYRGMRTRQIAALVSERIQEKIDEVTG